MQRIDANVGSEKCIVRKRQINYTAAKRANVTSMVRKALTATEISWAQKTWIAAAFSQKVRSTRMTYGIAIGNSASCNYAATSQCTACCSLGFTSVHRISVSRPVPQISLRRPEGETCRRSRSA